MPGFDLFIHGKNVAGRFRETRIQLICLILERNRQPGKVLHESTNVKFHVLLKSKNRNLRRVNHSMK